MHGKLRGFTILGSLTMLAVLTGCPKEGPAEQGAEGAKSATEEAGSAAKGAAEKGAGAVEDATAE